MKCTRFEDWLEQYGEESPGPAWESILVHSRACPDCALASQHRSELLETLRHLPAPEEPAHLREMIALALDAPPDPGHDGPGWFDEVLEPWLKPLQIGLAVGCLVMVVSLGTLSRDVPGPATPVRPRLVAHAPAVSPPADAIAARAPAERPVTISPAEVAAFMKRLEEYRRLHPEMEMRRLPGPAVETVGFRRP